MGVFTELLKSDVGILSSITILMCITISVVFMLWTRKQIRKDEAQHRQKQSE